MTNAPALTLQASMARRRHVAGDYPEWLDPHLARVFGDERAEEGAALASRAPLDLRVNTLEPDRDKAAAMLADLKPEPTRWSPYGLRIRLAGRRQKPGDPCRAGLPQGHGRSAGRGLAACRVVFRGKARRTGGRSLRRRRRQDLALAAMMENKGQIYATDDDKRRLAPIHERLARSGARNVQVRTPKSVGDTIADLAGRIDLVLIDAPCTGTGAWRRNPDAKWRMRPGALDQRVKEQSGDPRSRRAVAQGRRADRLHHLFGAGRGKRRAGARLPDARMRAFPSQPPAEVAGSAGRTRLSCSPRRRASLAKAC